MHAVPARRAPANQAGWRSATGCLPGRPGDRQPALKDGQLDRAPIHTSPMRASTTIVVGKAVTGAYYPPLRFSY
jgi:hypothetical protein